MATDTVEITRYPNRRLYDRSRGQYVTLTEIEEMVRQGQSVSVTDNKSGEDLTRAVLVQIILERHPERMDLFPVSLLHTVLRANDLALDWMRTYLRQSLAYMEHLPSSPMSAVPPFAPPLTGSLVGSLPTPLDWMKAFFPTPPTNTGGAAADRAGEPNASQSSTPARPTDESQSPSAPATVPVASASTATDAQAALVERLAELERRLRELESQRLPQGP